MERYILAHDIGTSGNKATLYTAQGRLVRSVKCSYETFYEQENWAEQDPRAWWKAVCEATQQLTGDLPPRAVAAIACSGMMLACLCLDKHDQPLMNAIIWSDSRAAEECERFQQLCGKERINQITGLHPTANSTVPKLMWVRNHRPAVWQETALCVQPKDYISFLMTGRHVTDPTDADYYQCFDLEKGDWSDEILQAVQIPRSFLPEVIPSTGVVGPLTEAAAQVLGLEAGIPVVAGAGDGPASCLGSGGVRPGIAVLTLGSSCGFGGMVRYCGPDPLGRVPVGPGVGQGVCGVGGAMQTGGVALQWLLDAMGDERLDVASLDRLAARSAPGAGGVIFLPYLMGERTPVWNARARGAFLNLNRNTSQVDLARAVMEGVALHLATIHDIVEEFGPIDQIVASGGGAKSELWLSIISNVLGKPVRRYEAAEESTSFGAAMIAAVGAGLLPDFNNVPKALGQYQEFQPNEEAHHRYQRTKMFFREAYQRLEPLFNRMNDK